MTMLKMACGASITLCMIWRISLISTLVERNGWEWPRVMTLPRHFCVIIWWTNKWNRIWKSIESERQPDRVMWSWLLMRMVFTWLWEEKWRKNCLKSRNAPKFTQRFVILFAFFTSIFHLKSRKTFIGKRLIFFGKKKFWFKIKTKVNFKGFSNFLPTLFILISSFTSTDYLH